MPTHENNLKYRPVLWLVIMVLCLSLTPAMGQKKDKTPAPPPPPPPPPATPEYAVIDLGVGNSHVDRNQAGQILVSYADRFEVWDGGNVTVISWPDDAWVAAVLGLSEDDGLDFNVRQYAARYIGDRAIVAGDVSGEVFDPVSGAILYRFSRPYVAVPTETDGQTLYRFDDVGPLAVHPDGDPPEDTVDATLLDMSDTGCLVGTVEWSHWTYVPGFPGPGRDGTLSPVRLMPECDEDGVPVTWYVEGAQGENALAEVLGEPRIWTEHICAYAADNAGRAYLYDHLNATASVVLAGSLQPLPLASAADRFKARIPGGWSANKSGVVAGGCDKSKPSDRFSSYVPAYVRPKVVNGEYVWFEANTNGTNRLLVKLGTLSGYADNSYVNSVNDSGQMVGFGSSSSGTRAIIWKGTTAVDLNTLIDPAAGVVLTGAGKITDDGVILCQGQRDGQTGWYMLVPK